jgi:hypothetical protein
LETTAAAQGPDPVSIAGGTTLPATPTTGKQASQADDRDDANSCSDDDLNAPSHRRTRRLPRKRRQHIIIDSDDDDFAGFSDHSTTLSESGHGEETDIDMFLGDQPNALDIDGMRIELKNGTFDEEMLD